MNNSENYYSKYLKYKNKYLELQKQIGGKELKLNIMIGSTLKMLMLIQI